MAARVAELRHDGHDIRTTYESAGDTRWARYVLLPPRPIPDSGVQEALTW
jgi:hypothetical protein